MFTQTRIHDTRTITLHSESGELMEFADPAVHLAAVSSVSIDLFRGDTTTEPTTWSIGEVAVHGSYVFDGEVSGMTFRREFHPAHVTGRRYHHADMPAVLSELAEQARTGGLLV